MTISGGQYNIVSTSLGKRRQQHSLIRSYNTVILSRYISLFIGIGIVKAKGRQTVVSGGQNNLVYGTNSVILVSTFSLLFWNVGFVFVTAFLNSFVRS